MGLGEVHGPYTADHVRARTSIPSACTMVIA